RILLKLEELQEENIRRSLEPKAAAVPGMTAEEHAAALELLRSPNLLEKILSDFDACGVVGEDTNKLVGYLAATSRKFERPLGVIIQSTSASGKTTLMEAVLAFMPEEERVKYSALTGQALFYLGEQDIRHKILAIAEEEGAEKATYALKLLQSEGELTIAATGWSPPQVKRHMMRLHELEYILTHRGGRGQGYVYELIYQGEGGDGTKFLPGLITSEQLTATQPNNPSSTTYDGDRDGQNDKRHPQG
ncbi:MAG: hypothetical protein ACK5TA_04385, partial [bacterium]